MKYTATIIGCGSIGATKPNDYDYPGGDNILTHAHACWENPRIEINGFYDINRGKFLEAYYKWLAPLPEYQNKVFTPFESDIYIIANDTSVHKDSLLKVLEYKPKLVIVEKPVGSNLAECQQIVSAYKAANVPLIADYTRRFAPGLRKHQGLIKSAYNAVLHYNRGLIRDGCHGLDLFLWFFGDVLNCRKLSDFEIHDYAAYDPTIGVFLETERCPHCLMLPVDSRIYGAFEFDIWHKNGRTRFVDHCSNVEVTGTYKEPTYGGYTSLGKTVIEKTDLVKALPVLYDNVVDYLDDPVNTELMCVGDDALKVWEVLDMLI